jgi:nicotinate-nucleotide adenylyltransferase
MGADNLRSFHRWQRWRDIAKLVPFVVIDRLGPSLYAGASPAGQALLAARRPEHTASTLPGHKPPAWTFLHGLKSPLSSTALRALRKRGGTSSSRGKRKTAKPAAKKTGKPTKPAKRAAASSKRAKSINRKPGKSVRRKGGKKRL